MLKYYYIVDLRTERNATYIHILDSKCLYLHSSSSKNLVFGGEKLYFTTDPERKLTLIIDLINDVEECCTN